MLRSRILVRKFSTSGFSIKGEAVKGKPAYLDVQATSPMDPRVLDSMMPYFTHQYGNPHSRTHEYGWTAEEAVEKAREQIGSLINSDANTKENSKNRK